MRGVPAAIVRRWRVVVLSLMAAVALYGVIFGLVLPPFARKAIAEDLGGRWGRVVVIDDLAINPYTLGLTMKGFRILEPDGRATFASFDRLDVDGSIASIRHLAPVADSVTLSGLKVNLVRDGDSHYNVTDIVERLAAAPKARLVKNAEYSLANIRFTGGRLDFDDRPKGKKHQVTGIEIAIPFVSNLPTHLKEFVQPKFSAEINGAPLRFTGETLPFENSLRTHLAIDLDSLEVPRYVEYSPAALPVKIDAGKLDAHLSVRFAQAAGNVPSIDVTGKLALRDVRLSTPGEAALAGFARIDLDLASLDPLAGMAHVNSLRVTQASANRDRWTVAATEAKDIRIDSAKRSVRVESLSTRDGALALTRLRDGSIEVPMRPAHAEATAADSPAPWILTLGHLSLSSYKFVLADESVKPAATHRVAIAQLDAAGLTTEGGGKGTMSAKLEIGKAGSADLESTFSVEPLSLNARIDARRIDLVAFRPYVEQFATVALKSADASAKGTLTMAGKGNAMRIAYSGSANIAKVASVDTASREDLVNWDSVSFTGVDFAWTRSDPLHIAVSEIAVKKAYARVVITPEGKINLQQLKAATDDGPGTPAPAAEPPKPRDIRIDRIAFTDSRLNFTDHFIRPNYTADVGELHGSVTNLSSDPASRGVVDLQGSYDQASPVAITGTINPLSGDLFLDVAANARDIALPRLTAYSERYAGYGITQGKLTLDVKYHVENGKLEGRNKIVLDQLVFGEKVASPDATTLPVLFAVNLLKDSKGVIDITLPISGSLEDPQFALGDLITQVIVGLLKKALTSPFSLLAAIGGGGSAVSGEDLSFVDFQPGREDIGPESEKRLDTLAKALLDRPAITIELTARVDEVKDLQALKQAELMRMVKEAKRSALAAGGKAAPTGDITLEADEYPLYLRFVFNREKVAGKDGASKDPPNEPSVAQMEALLLERIEIGPNDLGALALRRSEIVKDHLVSKRHLPAERVLLASAPGSAPAEKSHLSRVDFALK